MFETLKMREGQPLSLNLDLTFYSFEVEEAISINVKIIE